MHEQIRDMLDLPIAGPVDPEWVQEYSEEVCHPQAVRSGFTLRPEQAYALFTYEHLGAVLCSLRVGGGKSLIGYGVAQTALRVHGKKRGLLLVPNSVYTQTLRGSLNDAYLWLKDFRKEVKLLTIHGLPPRQRLARAMSNYNLMVLPYSYLSMRDSEDLLRAIAPEFVIADEAHRLRNDKAAGPRRLFSTLRMLEKERQEEVHLALMSGTLTKRSLFDYWKLARLTLGNGCPLPATYNIAKDLAVGTDSNPLYPEGLTYITAPIVNWARENFPDQAEEFSADRVGARRALRQRVAVTPGVVSTTSDEIDVPLVIEAPVLDRKNHPGIERLDALDNQLAVMGITPYGDEAESGLHIWRYRHELSSGMYHHLYWPTVEDLMKGPRKVSQAKAEELLEHAKERHTLVNAYHKALRKWLDANATYGIDTPMLVASNMAEHGAKNVGDDLFRLWRAARDMDMPGLPERKSKPVLVSDFRVPDLLDWANKLPKKQGGVVWCHHISVRSMAAQALKNGTKREVVECPSNDVRAYNQISNENNGHIIFVVTCRGYGIGLNLQKHLSRNYYFQWPRSAETAEQSLGRTHRPGQVADEVTCRIPTYSEFDKELLSSTIMDAGFIEQTSGSSQRLMLAAYDPVPEIYPPELLRQRIPGFEIPDKATQDALLKKFRVPS